MKCEINFALCSSEQELLFQKQQSLTKQQYDLIGPPNPVSNLRPVKFAVRENETKLDKLLRQKQEELNSWNEDFWKKHNERYLKEKDKFVSDVLKKRNSSDQQSVSADELSVFYKDFLDKNWKNHFNYNINWYRQHFYVTFLEFKVKLHRLIK